MDETADPRGAIPDRAASAVPLRLEALIERWWEDHFPGSVAAQVTQIWNHAFAAKEELKRRLKEGM